MSAYQVGQDLLIYVYQVGQDPVCVCIRSATVQYECALGGCIPGRSRSSVSTPDGPRYSMSAHHSDKIGYECT